MLRTRPPIRPITTLLLCLVLASATTFAAGCSRSRDPEPGRPGEPSTLVLLTIDTWRRDANGFLGGRRPSPTPFLDRLASDSLVFTDAVAPVPMTAPSHWSMLNCRWPWRAGLRDNGDVPADDDARSLPFLLRARGWRTAAFVSAAVLDHRFGFGSGFEHYGDEIVREADVRGEDIPERAGDKTVGDALKWIEHETRREQPLFLWLHLFDPHFPYGDPNAASVGSEAAYLEEVRFADQQVRRLQEGLERLGRPLENSLWVVLADHGEGLGEHGEQTHGLLLHGATTRIPMLIHGLGGRRGHYDALATTVDIVPTILAAMSIEQAAGCDGVNLLEHRAAGDRAIPLESLLPQRAFGLSPAIGLRTRRWLWESSPRDHLWDLVEDPRELEDRAAAESDRVVALRRRREGFPPAVSASSAPISSELRAKLNALGYLSGSERSGSGDVRAFARDGMSLYAKIVGAQKAGDKEAAERYVTMFLDRYAGAPDIWIEAGFIAVQRGDLAEAERRFRRATELAPNNSKACKAWLNLGNVCFQTGRLEEAEAYYRKVLSLDATNYFGLFNLALVLDRLDRRDEALEFWRRFAEDYPRDAMADRARQRIKKAGR